MRGAALLTAKEVCARLRADGIGEWEPGTLWAWTLESPPLPVAVRGKSGRPHKYAYADVLAWLKAREERQQQQRDPRLEKAFQEARLARLRADELERRLVPAAEVEQAMGAVVDAARTALESLPARLTRLLHGDTKVHSIIDGEVRRILERMAHGLADD